MTAQTRLPKYAACRPHAVYCDMLAQYWALTKPRVTQLAIFCAVIGMFLSTSELPPWRLVVAATLGIWLLAGAAFAVNSLIEKHIDARNGAHPHAPIATWRTVAVAGDRVFRADGRGRHVDALHTSSIR